MIIVTVTEMATGTGDRNANGSGDRNGNGVTTFDC